MQLFINITGLLLCYENLSLFTYNFSLFLDFFCSHFSRKDNDIFFVFFFFSINHSYVRSKWRQKKNHLVSFAFLSLSRDILNSKEYISSRRTEETLPTFLFSFEKRTRFTRDLCFEPELQLLMNNAVLVSSPDVSFTAIPFY